MSHSVTSEAPECKSLEWAHPLVREWFVRQFGTPTEPQEQGWPHILARKNTLICAPTGSGKTLAAFLACIDRAGAQSHRRRPARPDRSSVRFSAEGAWQRHSKKFGQPARRNSPACAHQRGYLMPEIRTAVRTGDTLMHDRRAMQKRPPHILVTTPESLYILLTAAKEPRNAAHGSHRHRGRNPCGRGRQARRASGAVARTSGSAHRATAPAHRPFRHAEADRTGRAISRWQRTARRP